MLPALLLEDGFGLLITESGLRDVPECLVTFAYPQPLELGARVTLVRVRRAPPLDEAEDYSGDP